MLALPSLVRLCFFLFSVILHSLLSSSNAFSRSKQHIYSLIVAIFRTKRLRAHVASMKIEIEVWFCSIIWTESKKTSLFIALRRIFVCEAYVSYYFLICYSSVAIESCKCSLKMLIFVSTDWPTDRPTDRPTDCKTIIVIITLSLVAHAHARG